MGRGKGGKAMFGTLYETGIPKKTKGKSPWQTTVKTASTENKENILKVGDKQHKSHIKKNLQV